MPKSSRHDKFAAWVTETREAMGMSQSQLARRLGKSQGWIARTETGERRMDIVEFIEFAEALGASPAKMFQRVLDRLR